MSIKTNGVSLTKTPRVSLYKRNADGRIKTAAQRAWHRPDQHDPRGALAMFTDEQRADMLALLDYCQPDEEHDAVDHERENGDLEGHIILPIRRLRAVLESATGGVPVVDCDGDSEFFERVEDAEAFADARNKKDGTDGYIVETQWPAAWPPEGIHDAESAADLIAEV